MLLLNTPGGKSRNWLLDKYLPRHNQYISSGNSSEEISVAFVAEHEFYLQISQLSVVTKYSWR